jgi:hypothetical protein
MSLLDSFEPVQSKPVKHCKGCDSECGSVRIDPLGGIRVMTCCGYRMTGPDFN